jgi:hypothetical protein
MARRAKQGIDISMLGIPEVQRKLDMLKRGVQKTIINKAARVAGKPLQARLKANARGVSKRLGRYTWPARIIKKSKTGLRGIVYRSPAREKLGIPASSQHYWPAALEYGHAIRKTPGGPQVGFADARPYVRPALFAMRPVVMAKLRTEVVKQMDAQVRKLAAKGKLPPGFK